MPEARQQAERGAWYCVTCYGAWVGKAAADARWSDPAQRDAARQRMQRRWQDPAYRATQVAKRESPAAREKQSLRAQRTWAARKSADPAAGRRQTLYANAARSQGRTAMRLIVMSGLLKRLGVIRNRPVAGYQTAWFVPDGALVVADDTIVGDAVWATRAAAWQAAGYQVVSYTELREDYKRRR